MKLPSVAEIRKAIVNALGLAGLVVTYQLVHGRLLLDLEVGITALTAIVHYLTPNAQPVPTGLPPSDFKTDPTPAQLADPAQPPATV